MSHLSNLTRDFEHEVRELRREWRHDLTVRWLLAIDTSIRRAARAIASVLRGRGHA